MLGGVIYEGLNPRTYCQCQQCLKYFLFRYFASKIACKVRDNGMRRLIIICNPIQDFIVERIFFDHCDISRAKLKPHHPPITPRIKPANQIPILRPNQRPRMPDTFIKFTQLLHLMPPRLQPGKHV
jgi:hypothetical protein